MTREEKINEIISDCITKMSDDDKLIYRPIVEYALALGYTPKPIKTAGGISDELAFSKSKVKRTLFRMNPNEKHTGKADLRLVFYATPQYSEPFRMGIKNVIEAFDGKYTGCYGCGRCKDSLEGYTYVYPDGKTVFRCGGELIRIPATLTTDDVEEIKKMMKAQDEFWINKIASKKGLQQ